MKGDWRSRTDYDRGEQGGHVTEESKGSGLVSCSTTGGNMTWFVKVKMYKKLYGFRICDEIFL